MGRRKIEIRPINDDRNRSVTFLKRKGGLFKKAFELSMLCSVDIAVIVFGTNKKLYEFSSSDMSDTIARYQYYAGPHEHKGPSDYARRGGGGGDDDDDEDVDIGTPPPEEQTHSPPEPSQLNHMASQPAFHHVRHATPSASPPLPHGAIPQHRSATPQAFSRPASRTAIPRRPSNLSVQNNYTPPQAQMTQANYAYGPNSAYYNHHHANVRAASPQPPPQPHQHQHSYPPPAHAHLAQQYIHDQRRQSMPPAFSVQVHQPQRQPSPQPPPPHQRQPSESRRHSPHAEQGAFQSPPLPQPKALAPHASSHSIFTPIEDSRSLLAQHWGGPPSSEMTSIEHRGHEEDLRAHSIDTGTNKRHRANGGSPQLVQYTNTSHAPPRPQYERQSSIASVTSIPPPTRSNTMQSDTAKRPRLKVQIPSEQSDGGEPTLDSSERETLSATAQTLPPAHKGVVLPPPSPSANNSVLSAGATGPPNPFARPAPPSSNPPLPRDRIETPLSALPSRIMDGGNTLPSPSDMWGGIFSRTNSDNMMPSPLNWQPTPIIGNGPSFRDDHEADRKRRAEGEASNGEVKRVRT